MKYAISLLAVFLTLSVAHAELMVVDVTIVKKPDGGWSYVVSEGDKREFPSDAALGDYLKKLSNPRDGIWLTMQSESDVPVDQLSKILAMVKANPQGIVVKRIVLDTKRSDRPK
jgi:hypothetical protein